MVWPGPDFYYDRVVLIILLIIQCRTLMQTLSIHLMTPPCFPLNGSASPVSVLFMTDRACVIFVPSWRLFPLEQNPLERLLIALTPHPFLSLSQASHRSDLVVMPLSKTLQRQTAMQRIFSAAAPKWYHLLGFNVSLITIFYYVLPFYMRYAKV